MVSSASPLVAVLLIASTSSRSPELVFRYPRKPKLLKRYSKVRYYAADKDQGSAAGPSGSHQQDASRRTSLAEHGLDVDQEQQRNMAQWEEQEDDSEGSSLDHGSQDGEDSSSDSDSEALSEDDFIESESEDTRSMTAASEDTDLEASSEVLGTSHTAASGDRRSRRPSRRSARDWEPSSRLTSRNPASSAGGSGQRRRSPSKHRLVSSSLRDPTVDASPERGSHGGEAGRRRPGTTNGQSRRGLPGASGSSPSKRAKNARAFSHYLGYPVDFLAEILAPKKEMCNRRFELVVDDLAFVGHPVARTAGKATADNDDPSQSPDQRGRKGRDGGIPASTSTTSMAGNEASAPEVTMFHLVLVLQPPDPSYATPTLDLTTWLGFWYDNVSFKMTAALWAEEDRCRYISTEAELLHKLWGEVEGDSGAGPSYELHLSRLMVISSLGKSLKQMYRSLIHPSSRTTPFVSLNDSLDVHLQLPPLLVDPAKMVKSITELGPSIEAEDVEAWVDGGRNGEGNALDEWTRATGPPLFPWRTLLLLHDPEEDEEVARRRRFRSVGGQVVAIDGDEDGGTPSDTNLDEDEFGETGLADAGIEIWARKFTSLLKPTLQGVPTFADLAALLSWDLKEDVYPMARHLVYYKQARVSDVPRIQNTYAISPLFELNRLSYFATSYAIRFPEQPPLARLLAAVGSGLRPFIAHFVSIQEASSSSTAPSRRKEALDTLIWLLRHEIILQQHLRFRLIATEAVKRKARELWEERQARRDELRRRREERRVWREEKRALKRGADPNQREGDMVPMQPRSAPDERSSGANVASAIEKNDRGRGRPRSRSAEARDRGVKDGDEDASTMDSVAARIASNSRSRSRKPPLLGRIASGRITPSPAHSRPPSASLLRRFDDPAGAKADASVEVASPGLATGLAFERRPVLRSRSPSTAFPITSVLPTTALSNPTSAGSPVVSNATGIPAIGTSRNRGTSIGSNAASATANTPREKATMILAEQNRRRAGSVAANARPGSGSDGAASSPSIERPSSSLGRGRARGYTIPHVAVTAAAGSIEGGPPRNPSRARMRVKGFGDQEEVWVDGEVVKAEDDEPVAYLPPNQKSDEPAAAAEGATQSPQKLMAGLEGIEESRRLSLVGEEDADAATASSSLDRQPRKNDDTRGEASQTSRPAGAPATSQQHAHFAQDEPADSSPSSTEDEEEADFDDDDEDGEAEPSYDFAPSLICEPSRASREENVWIAAMLSTKDDATSQSFFRLLPYLNGRHTIDEVIVREEMRRRELRLLLGEFKEEILTFAHP